MAQDTRRSVSEGAVAGLLAGLVFAVVEVLAAAAMGSHPLAPLRMFASILLGTAALGPISLGVAVLVGIIVHVVLSAIYGVVYGRWAASWSEATRTSWGRQAGLGILFGLILWFVNFQIIARVAFPWFLAAPQFPQLLMHALFFGLPLALFHAASERRVGAPMAIPRR